ncbi:IreB family regulatory phosphoprotein [Salinicoccus albus]|uniref:IreB family regulatory phosphoprotein n=1 Tax=Salinicoccus albus TaxID=418756 RepID=UPI00047841F5|nr:IreB family regulatory phosphoprotein [Salinicoccus albus]
MNQFDETRKFSVEDTQAHNVKEILTNVYKTLEARGYNPINQIVGYLQSGDPAYIPRHNEARNNIRHVDRDEIMEVLVRTYIEQEINE